MIALDAMGGDLAPAATVEGALRAHRERGLEIVLVGGEARLRAELRRLGAGDHELRVHHASEVVEMAEHPGQALRRKKDSSIRVLHHRVGVVANGEEEGKGTDLTRAAAAALRKPESGVRFQGYVEGKDVFSGDFDVIATDGFTGNVLLKTAEGAVWAFGQLLK